MNKKLRSTLVLLGLLVVIVAAGLIYLIFIQGKKLDQKREKLKELNAKVIDPVELNNRYMELAKRSAELDSILANRKFNIPQNISSIKFFNFINGIISGFSDQTQVNVEYLDQKQDKEFLTHSYKLSGFGYFNEVYRLIYAIEQSKELKKIKTISFGNLVKTDKNQNPLFLVNFTMDVVAYFSTDSRFAPAVPVENNLGTGQIYDAFFPLIRNEIPPNVDGLLDVQGARLLALIPEGAFIADTKGNTFLVWEGEQVYLGYLTKIDYQNSKVSFVLNKGGIIENVDLELDRSEFNKKK
ncbi:Hypothetical protein IALB_0559 [Ignavibacterium album JCM 16511]|uniref:Tfp pilus assembly protein PilO n=1 Tax=Ignavibacterium album (strain DSM 19864 / JCM 16511 / NBRC 101810 / Mat9-16) TaxID=945713 RepID=I0AH14_IGNAJ|nr:hypothetical protein [Ignavibacterium album]AFH48271.1 Hypothetical protein IALB_0559 [Ignavibacterium album JCM 16511]